MKGAVRSLEVWLGDCIWSPVYETDPLHVTEQPRFLNACGVGWTDVEPAEVLERLKALERAAGRAEGGVRFGPRELDLDLLLYGERVVRTDRLTIPHPRMLERGFVLRPLSDIAGKWPHPETGVPIAAIVAGREDCALEATNLRLDGEGPTLDETIQDLNRSAIQGSEEQRSEDGAGS